MDDSSTPTQEGEPMAKREKDMAELEKTTPVATAAPQPTSTPTPQPQISPAPQVTGEPPPPPPTDTPGKKNPVLWIAITLFVLALLAGGAYVALNTGLLTKEKACTQEVMVCPDGTSVGRVGPNCEFAPCPTPTETLDETANWTTYKDEKSTFSFKYPAEWTRKDSKSNDPVYLLTSTTLESPQTKLYVGDSRMFMNECMELTKSENITITSLAFIKKSFQRIVEGEMCGGEEKLKENLEIWIAPVDTTKFQYGFIYNYTTGNKIVAEETLDQILSTFKLIEATPSASPTSSPSASPSP